MKGPRGVEGWFNVSALAPVPPLPVGAPVRLAPSIPDGVKLRGGEVGMLITDDGSDRPYEVRAGGMPVGRRCGHRGPCAPLAPLCAAGPLPPRRLVLV